MIYKPTDLSPSVDCFDIQEPPIFFECKIDTSNTNVGGLTVRVYDGENNLVFSSIPEGEPVKIEYITLISDIKNYMNTNYPSYTVGYKNLNTGKNGTYIKFPFVVSMGLAGYGDSVYRSQVFYDSTDGKIKRYTGSGGNTENVNLYNGNEYKWAITLYQLQQSGNSLEIPEDPRYYDMLLTNGVALGSNDKRIQTIPSDEIYQDYFIHPVFIPGLKYDPNHPEAWSMDSNEDINDTGYTRVILNSYDPTYGYLYPTTGPNGFQSGTISVGKDVYPNGFRIYRYNNKVDDLSVTRQVLYVCENPLDEVYYTSSTSNDAIWGAVYGVWEFISNDNTTGNSKWQQIFNSPVKLGEKMGYSIPGFTNIVISGNERIVFNNMQTMNVGGCSPYNGIFYPKIVSETVVPLASTSSTYDSSSSYSKGDFVKIGNTNYECTGVVKGVVPAVGTYWELLGSTGSGAQYDSNKEYIAGNVVYIRYLEGRSYYRCRGVVKGKDPADATNAIYWTQAGEATGYQYVIDWYRTPDASTWGDLKNKVVTVTSPDSDSYYLNNIQIQDVNDNFSEYGTINLTPFKFVKEKPIEIYKNYYSQYDNNTTYNYGDTVSYIKPGNYLIHAINLNYTAGDIVYDQGFWPFKFYICLQDCAGSVSLTNTTYWMPYISQSYYFYKSTTSGSQHPPISYDGSIDSGYWKQIPYHGDTGLIFYNNALGEVDPISSSGDADGRLYIRHFEGLKNGMVLFRETDSNLQDYYIINNYNSDYNFVEYSKRYTFDAYLPYNDSTNPTESSTEDPWVSYVETTGTRYRVKTFFRESDESLFSLYSKPSLTITTDSSTISLLKVSGEYSQQQFVMWRNAQWFLYNNLNEVVDKSDILYDGYLQYTFEGVANGNYKVELVVENYAGTKVNAIVDVSVNTVIQDSSDEDVSIAFDCDKLATTITVNNQIEDLIIYKREVWYVPTGNIINSESFGQRVPEIIEGAAPIWHKVYSALDYKTSSTHMVFGIDVVVSDFNVGNNRTYEYSVLYYKNSLYYKKDLSICVNWSGWTLTELHAIDGQPGQYSATLGDVWKFKYNISPGDVAQNFAKNVQDTLGRFPKFTQGPRNNLSGNVSCLLGRDMVQANYTNVDYTYNVATNKWDPQLTSGYNLGGYQERLPLSIINNNSSRVVTSNQAIDMLKSWESFCFSGNPKLLRDSKGRTSIIDINGASFQTEETWTGRPITINFEWNEIEETNRLSIYGVISTLEYELNEDQETYSVVGIGNVMGDNLIIPPVYNGKSVTSIGNYAFSDCYNLKGISIPSSVTSIGDFAFKDCGLEQIVIPYGVTDIGDSAFEDCINLSIVDMSPSVINMGDKAFASCFSLSSISLSNNVESIESETFLNCRNLTSIVIPDSVTRINNSAFEGCNSLMIVVIPDDVGVISNRTFYGCGNLTSVFLGSYTTEIGEYAFGKCSKLTGITIPDSVTSIGTRAFYDCRSLTSATFGENSQLESIGNYAFDFCDSLTSIEIPDSVTGIGNFAFGVCRSLTSATFGENSQLESIGNGAFSQCSGLTSVTIPDSVTSMGNSAFDGCSSLTSITIPDGITMINRSVFQNCSSLTSIEIPEGVTYIGDNAFYGCSGLTSVTIPDSVTGIGSSVFRNCSSLTSITIGNNVTDIVSSAFRGCSSLTSVTIPDSVTSISEYAFQNCSNLTSVTIGNGVRWMGEYAFQNCSNLTSVTISAVSPPALWNSSVFSNTNGCPIYVPAQSVDRYKVAPNWSSLASRIFAIQN